MTLRSTVKVKCIKAVMAQLWSSYTKLALDLSPPVLTLHNRASFIGAMLLFLLRLAVCAPPVGVAYASTSGALHNALASVEVSMVYLTGSLTLNPIDWKRAIAISRNVTVAAPPQYEAIGAYITVDFSSIVAGIIVQPGGQITFRWMEMVNFMDELGQAMLLVSASPGGRVVFDHVVQRRMASFGGKRALEDIYQLPRLEGFVGNQTAFFLPRFCYNSSRDGGSHCSTDLVYIVDVAARLGPSVSTYYSAGALGQYDMILEESVQISDVVVDPNCLPAASEWDCMVRQLRLMAFAPVLIKAKPSASNLVKIVASLAILMAAVGLFLYFRRHYRTYQERRARRMRRIKQALGMNREAHGIVFNGLDGEVPDWQIMPMPVGYAPDEGSPEELYQDSTIRNLIQDISSHPNGQIPTDYMFTADTAAPVGAGAEPGGMEASHVAVTLSDTAPIPRSGGRDNCPIAAEVGLRRPANVVMVGQMLPAGDPVATTSEQSPMLLEPAARPGLDKTDECFAARQSLACAQYQHTGSDGSRLSGATAAVVSASAVHLTRESGDRETTGASHQSTSANRLVPLATGAGSGKPPQLQPALNVVTLYLGTVGTSAVGQSNSSGGRCGCQGLELGASSTMAVTKAGMDLLMASRAAATAALIGGSGGGTTAAAAGCHSRSVGSKDSSWHLHKEQPHPKEQQQPSEQQQKRATQEINEQEQMVDSAERSAESHTADSRGGSETATAAANRQAVTSAAVDVATRVLRSKDSDAAEERGGTKASNCGRVASLIDELEQLRRDIMTGINDTQLQIMSVVGSGAFGTVYRGQWQGLEVAVKTVVFSASSENRKRALQEAALCQSINHRNIVATYAVDVQPLGAVNTPVLLQGGVGASNRNNSTLSNLLDWRLYIVQEFCDGGPLRKLVQSQYLQTRNGPNMLVICEVALELAQALAHLHSKNVIHGDLNPNNVLLKRDTTSPIGFRVKVADFGLSVMVPLQKTHMSNLRLGTLYYIAPETCFRGQLGYAADVFSLGVMLWELYHGRLAGTRTPTGEPRYQPDFPDFPATCSVDYRKLAHRCLQKQPHNRLHSSQVVQRLQELITNFRAAVMAAPATAPPQLPPLPLGGPDESMLLAPLVSAVPPLPPPPQPPPFTQQALVALVTGGRSKPTSSVPTPSESRHMPSAGPAAMANTPLTGGTDSPRAVVAATAADGAGEMNGGERMGK